MQWAVRPFWVGCFIGGGALPNKKLMFAYPWCEHESGSHGCALGGTRVYLCLRERTQRWEMTRAQANAKRTKMSSGFYGGVNNSCACPLSAAMALQDHAMLVSVQGYNDTVTPGDASCARLAHGTPSINSIFSLRARSLRYL